MFRKLRIQRFSFVFLSEGFRFCVSIVSAANLTKSLEVSVGLSNKSLPESPRRK